MKEKKDENDTLEAKLERLENLSESSNIFERLFRLKENKTNVSTEILAGFTTFMTMAYIIFVNPTFLKTAGMDAGAAMVATCLASAYGCFLMGFFANYPIATAPGMGLNAFFTYSIVIGMGVSWQVALGVVFWAGLLYLILTLTKFRKYILSNIPNALRFSIGAGIGLFISVIGFVNAGIIIQGKGTILTLGNIKDPGVLVALAGVIITGFLMAKKIKGGLILGIILTTVLAMFIGKANFPTAVSNVISLNVPSLNPLFLKLDILGALNYSLIAIIFSIIIVDLFDTAGTLLGLTNKAKFIEKEGKFPRIERALIADSSSAVAGALMGTSTVTAYIESSAGISEGGRTGMAAIVTGILFLFALLFTPLLGVIPAIATAPALIVIGVLFMTEVTNIKFDDLTEGLPAFLTIIMMPLTFSIAKGLAFGFISFTLLKLFSGRRKEISPIIYVMSLLFILHFIFGKT